MDRTAEWWTNECGGIFCSSCGLFFDDYYGPPPNQGEKCGSKMTTDNDMYVHKEYRLSRTHSVHYIDESEYPAWLLEQRLEYLKNNNGES